LYAFEAGYGGKKGYAERRQGDRGALLCDSTSNYQGIVRVFEREGKTGTQNLFLYVLGTGGIDSLATYKNDPRGVMHGVD
jgi:hypothetical protein